MSYRTELTVCSSWSCCCSLYFCEERRHQLDTNSSKPDSNIKNHQMFWLYSALDLIFLQRSVTVLDDQIRWSELLCLINVTFHSFCFTLNKVWLWSSFLFFCGSVKNICSNKPRSVWCRRCVCVCDCDIFVYCCFKIKIIWLSFRPNFNLSVQ